MASSDLRKLRDLGFIEQKGKGAGTYYIKGENFPPEIEGEHTALDGEHTALDGEHTALDGEHKPLDGEHTALPSAISAEIENLGKRPGNKIRQVIVKLCQIHPFSAVELAPILSRKDPDRLKRAHIKPMIEAGDLKPLYDMERHPKQAYLATDNKTSHSDED